MPILYDIAPSYAWNLFDLSLNYSVRPPSRIKNVLPIVPLDYVYLISRY